VPDSAKDKLLQNWQLLVGSHRRMLLLLVVTYGKRELETFIVQEVTYLLRDVGPNLV